MLKYIKEYRFYIFLVAFLLIPVIAIDTSVRRPREYRLHDRVIVFITSPIQSLITSTLDEVVGFFQNYLFLWNTRRDSLQIIEENRKLLATIAQLQEAQQENTRLRRQIKFQEEFKLETIVARVIAKDVSTEFRAIRINRGENSGIQKDMAVMTNEGVVGRVLRTTSNTSDIVTVLDLLSAVDSFVARSRARGVVTGRTESVCQLKYALRTDDIEPGDVLIASGLGGIFPKGIPIGTVSRVDRKAYGISQEVEVRPSVDFSRLEEVLVVTHAESIPSIEKMKEKEPSPLKKGTKAARPGAA